MSSPPPPTTTRNPWLFSPGFDLLAGCGLGYAGVFLLLCAAGGTVKGLVPLSLLPLLALVAGAPHYGATLLRVYAEREVRRRHANVAVGATLVIAAAFLVSLRLHLLGSLLVTLYLLWSPWHYSAQNYGLARMLLGRRDVALAPGTGRLLRAVFTLPFLLFIVQSNGSGVETALGSEGVARTLSESAPRYDAISLGIPATPQAIAMGLLLAAYLVALALVALALVRRASARDLAPLAALVASQALWFAVPATARFHGWGQQLLPLDGAQSLYAFQWVAAAHAVQYLWVTAYFDRRAGASSGVARFYARSLLAGQALWSIPALLFAPLVVGSVSYSADLVVLIAAVINLHHFILDGAIWRLRAPEVRDVLIASGTLEMPQPTRPPHAWRTTAAVTAGLALVSIEALSTVDRHAFLRALAAANPAQAEHRFRRLDALGRADAILAGRLGHLAEDGGNLDLAIEALTRSAELAPSSPTYQQLARIHLSRRDWAATAHALEQARSIAALSPELEQLLDDTRRLAERSDAQDAGGPDDATPVPREPTSP